MRLVQTKKNSRRGMEHPAAVLYLEHDGKVLLVDSDGNGPQKPVMKRIRDTAFRFPTIDEVAALEIDWS